MISPWKKWLTVVMVLLLTCVSIMGLGAAIMAQAPSAVSIYSIWIRLSLRGMNQSEIESLMRNMDQKDIDLVKERLRNTVISNLESKKIQEQFLTSRDSDDLHNVITSIETELRFAGLQNDEEVRVRIKERFGIALNRL